MKRLAEKDAEENGKEGHRGRLEFFSEKENQETQQPHPREEPSLCRRGVVREGRRGASISFVVVVLSEKKPVEAARHRVEKTMKR